MGKKALVLGGGAPNFTLMSGALLALHEQGVFFDVIYMAGAGAVVGLVYLAPKGLTPAEALLNTMNYGISDQIYAAVPVNYKLFNKGGPSAEVFRDYWSSLPPVQAAMHQYGMNDQQKLAADMLLFTGAVACPSDVNYFSKGVCAHVPFIEGVVDFDKLKTIPQQYYLNAYCIDDEQSVEFVKPYVDLHHFRAALSFPYIYPPYQIDGKYYYEGASVDCLNLIAAMHEERAKNDIDTIVVLDVLRSFLIQRPRNLWDAYARSIIVPIVASAEKELEMFLHWVETGHIVKKVPPYIPEKLHAVLHTQEHAKKITPPPLKAYLLRYPIPDQQKPYALDWSKSNLETLFSVGYSAGKTFLSAYGSQL
ncbi:MAG TPA: patatin-like phospholipase family protein [Xanthobacteraceae bacterium]|nr:patatin-like phospholipase family protein [Xanthobacteraceae bacterium]